MIHQQLSISNDKCVKCEACVKACPACVLELTQEGVSEKFPLLCAKCGHCMAVCPTSAIRQLHIDEEPVPSEKTSITFDQFFKLSQNRRSIRNFSSRPVPENVLEELLDSVRYAPTGSNAQDLEYLVITNLEKLNGIRSAMARCFGSKIFKIVFSLVSGKKKAERIKLLSDRMCLKFSQGEDPFLRRAPVLVVICRRTNFSNAFFGIIKAADMGIAGHHLSLACETIGLGSCWIGWHTLLCKLSKSVRKASMIPPGCKAIGALAIGYHDVKYYRTCVRKQPQLTII